MSTNDRAEGRMCSDCDTMLAMDDWHDREDCIAALRADRDRLELMLKAAVHRGGELIAEVDRLKLEAQDDRITQQALVKRISELTAERYGQAEKHRTRCACRFSDDGEECVAWCEFHSGIRDRLAAEVETLRADAERWRHVEKLARQNTAYDVYGNGGHWSIGLFSKDGRLTFTQAVDAARAGEKSDD